MSDTYDATNRFQSDPSDSRALGTHKPATSALPRVERDKFLVLRKLKSRRSLNDLIEEIYLQLIEDETFLAFLDAVYDEQAIEGSLSADNYKACEMIREKAVEMGSTEVAHLKLATIGKSLNVVQRRYGLSRKERRYTVGGEIVPAPADNNSGSQE